MKMDLQEFREFICETPKGQVFDSLVAVELGLDEYEAAWDAHQDILEDEIFEDMVVEFLISLHDYIGFTGDEIEKVVTAAHE